MKKLLKALAVTLTLVLFVGCSSQVPPGFVGKKIHTTGVLPEIYETGKHYHSPFTHMVLINTSSELRSANVNVIMADYDVAKNGEQTRRIGLDMDFIVNIRYRIRNNDGVINSMLRDMTLEKGTKSVNVQQIYQKYGNMVIGRVTREVLGAYTPEEVVDNLKAINGEIFRLVKDGLENSPLEVSEVSLGQITLPKVIRDRITANKDTELEEAQAKARQRIDMLERRNQVELARQEAVRQEVDAKSMAAQNKILNQSITPEVLRLRELAIREREIEMMGGLAGKGNSTIFIPYGAVDNAGAQYRMFNQK